MNVLVVYGSYSGGTQSAAGVVADVLRNEGAEVEVKDVSEVSADELKGRDLLVLGSCSWMIEGEDGMPHEGFVALMEESEGLDFEGGKAAVYGLGESSYTHFCGAVDQLLEFVKAHNGEVVGGQPRIDGYFFDQEAHDEELQEWAAGLIS